MAWCELDLRFVGLIPRGAGARISTNDINKEVEPRCSSRLAFACVHHCPDNGGLDTISISVNQRRSDDVGQDRGSASILGIWLSAKQLLSCVGTACRDG